ncbi:MAG: hypothetical protein ACYTGB_06290 [Planctomycetota bacterium]|jgi:hypothetical protein
MRNLATCAAILVLAGTLAAAGELDEGRLDRPISLELKGVSFAKCLEVLVEKTGVNVIAQQEVLREMGAKPVTFVLKDRPVWAVVHLFARSCGLEVSHEHGVFVFEKAVEPDEVWAEMELEIDDGEIQIKVLRRDVNPELRRGLVARLLHRRLRRAEEEDEREEEGEEVEVEIEEEGEDRPVKKPAGGEDAPRKQKKDELF